MNQNLVRGCAVIMAGAMGLVSSLVAQTTENSRARSVDSGTAQVVLVPSIFTPPNDSVHAERYPMPEFCLAQLRPVSIRETRGSRPDTLPLNPQQPIPEAVVAQARRCLTLMPAATYDVIAAKAIRDIALLANDEDAFKVILKRQIAAAPPQERQQIWSTAIGDLLWDIPHRWNLARDLVERATELLGAEAGEAALPMAYGMLARYAASMQQYAAVDSLLVIIRALEARRPAVPEQMILRGMMQVEIYSILATIRAPREGATAYIATTDSMAQVLEMGGIPNGLEFLGSPILGQPVPAVSGQFRFPAPSGSTSLAEPGQVTLLAMVDAGCGRFCASAYGILHRLQRRHPDLRVTLVAPMAGGVRDRTPAPMAEQVEQLRAYFLDSLALARSIVVDTAPFMTLPSPDRRRVYGETPLEAALLPVHSKVIAPGKNDPSTVVFFVLVDRRGIVAGQSLLRPDSERFLSAYIGKLLEEQSGK